MVCDDKSLEEVVIVLCGGLLRFVGRYGICFAFDKVWMVDFGLVGRRRLGF